MKSRSNRNIGEVMKDEMLLKNRILSQLAEDPKTIPELSAALGYPSDEVMFWVMAMWRYGSLEDAGKPNDEGYYRYRLVK